MRIWVIFLIALIGLATPPLKAEYLRFEIDTGIFIQPTCPGQERTERSRIKLFVPPDFRPQQELVVTHAKLRVCVSGELIRDATSLVIPYKSLNAAFLSGSPRSGRVPISSRLMASEFGIESPTMIHWRHLRSTRNSRWYELEYLQGQDLRLGPIQVELVDPHLLAGLHGFRPHFHPGIRSLNIQVPDSSVLIRSRLVQVQPD